MPYRGIINYDFSNIADNNAANRLMCGLVLAGWTKAETTAFYIESEDLDPIWRGCLLVMRYNQQVGDLSALTFHVQLEAMTQIAPTTLANNQQALTVIEGNPLPHQTP